MKKKDLIIIVIAIIAMGVIIFFGLKSYIDNKYSSNNDGKIEERENNNQSINNSEQTKDYSEEIQNIFNTEKYKLALYSLSNGLNYRNETLTYFNSDEVITILYHIDKTPSFKTVEELTQGCQVYISVEQLQKLSKKYFNKEIDLENLESSDFVKEDHLYHYCPTGYGMINIKFNNVNKLNNNDYEISYDFDGIDYGVMTYILTINYNNGDIIFKSLRKEN